jgi:pyridinium-3,5-biscarboxylic acid mononucleotide synthase
MLDPASIRELLNAVAQGKSSVEQAMSALASLPFTDLGFATVDHHRALRQGFAEVVLCSGKTPEQVASIIRTLAASHSLVLGTRATPEHFAAAVAVVPGLIYHASARAITLDTQPDRALLQGVTIVAAGTSDLPVADEAAITLQMLGHQPERIIDVGVAGLHRLLHHLPALRKANVLIVVAGMEGALPSVVGGLVDAPVIAVPTSVGYGASFHGLAALLGMLNSCAAGVGVVNIDNGFGAARLAASINHRAHGKHLHTTQPGHAETQR